VVPELACFFSRAVFEAEVLGLPFQVRCKPPCLLPLDRGLGPEQRLRRTHRQTDCRAGESQHTPSPVCSPLLPLPQFTVNPRTGKADCILATSPNLAAVEAVAGGLLRRDSRRIEVQGGHATVGYKIKREKEPAAGIVVSSGRTGGRH
jgi:hypothetical protein